MEETITRIMHKNTIFVVVTNTNPYSIFIKT
jgi:hypothetical protein